MSISLVTLSLRKSYDGDVPRNCIQPYNCSGLWNKDLSNRRNFGCPNPGLWQPNQHHRRQQWSLCKQIVKVGNVTKVLIYESHIVKTQIAAFHCLHSLKSKTFEQHLLQRIVLQKIKPRKV